MITGPTVKICSEPGSMFGWPWARQSSPSLNLKAQTIKRMQPALIWGDLLKVVNLDGAPWSNAVEFQKEERAYLKKLQTAADAREIRNCTVASLSPPSPSIHHPWLSLSPLSPTTPCLGAPRTAITLVSNRQAPATSAAQNTKFTTPHPLRIESSRPGYPHSLSSRRRRQVLTVLLHFPIWSCGSIRFGFVIYPLTWWAFWNANTIARCEFVVVLSWWIVAVGSKCSGKLVIM